MNIQELKKAVEHLKKISVGEKLYVRDIADIATLLSLAQEVIDGGLVEPASEEEIFSVMKNNTSIKYWESGEADDLCKEYEKIASALLNKVAKPQCKVSVEELAKEIFNYQHKDSALIVNRFCGTHWDIAHECEKIEARELAQQIHQRIYGGKG